MAAGYKAKTIKAILSRKINKWIDSITDGDLQTLLKHQVIVTGGAIVSMLQGEEVNDFDIYLKDADTVKKVALYYVEKFKARKQEGIPVDLWVFDSHADMNTLPEEHRLKPQLYDIGKVNPRRIKIVCKSAGVAGIEGTTEKYNYFEQASPGEPKGEEYVSSLMDDPGKIEDIYQETEKKVLNTPEEEQQFKPVFLTSNAITLSNKVQIVLRFYGEPDEIHKNYDFVHCTSYWTNWDNKLTLRPEALESILCKELKYVGSKYPVCSVARLRKFIQRGWTINAGQILKMCMQISELDLTDVDVLEDQLTGVDTAYFVQLIAALKEKDPEKVNIAYLVEIVDRLF